MEADKVIFDALAWQAALPGARFKAHRRGQKQLRLLELTADFVEPHWCEKSHFGLVLSGELEIDFRGRIERYPTGSGILIAGGQESAHKARAITPSALLFLVEDAEPGAPPDPSSGGGAQ